MKAIVAMALLAGGCFDFEALSSGDAAAAPDDLSVAAPLDLGDVDLHDPLSCPATALSCEGFEAPDLGEWVPSASVGSGTTIDLVTAFSGVASLLAHSNGGTTAYAYVEYVPPVLATGTLYVRLWLRAQAVPTYTLFGIERGSFPLAFGVDKNGNWLVSIDSGNQDLNSSLPFAAGRWTCVTFDVGITDGAVRLAVDGVTAVLGQAQLGAPGPIGFVHLGLARAAPSGPSGVEIDDLVVSTSSISCF